ncbi:hypothetical protein A7976_06770 [Methylobacillus sp. MM3]|uniref:DUF2784 domain-containing protein n=1 Tax=Methylobacillus sp. MM3 TaxID=1848039 RepID=UPI0007E1A5A2|nr:DUF2784 domain-containing protein [Methylobacillus sp. MM3]OAJ71134.1 hypothetical protein A7976_06770 [Methylobacillus sp. MM3]
MPWPEQTFYRLLADLTLLAHFAFIIFVLLGGLLVLKWPQVAWLHIPAALWGALTEFFSLPCPLTPLEKHFQRLAGDTPYEGDFIARYLLPLIYPAGLTPTVQIVLGAIVVALNILIYGWLLARQPHG